MRGEWRNGSNHTIRAWSGKRPSLGGRLKMSAEGKRENKAGEEVARWRAWRRWAEMKGPLPFMNM
jgi:hypothetical protein